MTRTHGRPAPARADLPENNAATKPPALDTQPTAERGQTASTDDWARELIARAHGPIPAYGGSAFDRLPDGPTKVASAIIAAQRWRHRRVVETVTDRRAREIAEARRPRPGDHPGGPVPWEPTGGAA